MSVYLKRPCLAGISQKNTFVIVQYHKKLEDLRCMYISSRDNREKTGDIAFCEAKTNILQGKSLQQ